MTYPYSNTFQAAGVGQNGVVVNAYDASRFGSPPAFDDAPPGGSPDTTATTADSFGQPGAFVVELPTTDEYYLAAAFMGSTFWIGPVQGNGAGGGGSNGTGHLPTSFAQLDDVAWAYVSPYSGAVIDPYTYANGTAGVGATMTQNTPSDGILKPDGSTTPSPGDRVVVIDAWDTAPASGIYIVTAVGDGATVPWVLTRATDCDTAATIGANWTVRVAQGGTTYGGATAAMFGWDGESPDDTTFVPGTTAPAIGIGVDLQGAYAAGPWAVAKGVASAAVGYGASAAGNYAAALGPLSYAEGEFDTAVGAQAAATGGSSTAVGNNSQAVGNVSAAFGGGLASAAKSMALGSAAWAWSPGLEQFNDTTDNAGIGRHVSAIETTDATPVPLEIPLTMLGTDGVTPEYRFTLLVRAAVVARRTDTPGTDSAWVFADGVLRGDGSGAYSWVGGSAPLAPSPIQDVAAAAWAVSLAIVSNTLVFTVTGAAATTIFWTGSIELVQSFG